MTESLSREDQFKDHYVAAFMAAYKANEYQDRIDRGQYDALDNHGIVEYAEDLAESAWKAMVELSPRMREKQ